MQKLLEGVTAGQAFAHPIPNAHSIWELVLHVNAWAEAAVNALKGTPIPKFPWPQEKDFPPITDQSEAAWQQAVSTLFSTHKQFWQAIEVFDDSRLEEKVPGRSYTFYKLFMGWTDHMIYHAGQIALLKKAQHH